ncbi:lymphocyte antigen 75-like [Oryzias latipes]
MERLLVAVCLLSEIFTLSSCLRQYHFVNQSLNWTEAQIYCRQNYRDLATIEDPEELKQLINGVSSAGVGSDVWIGLYNQIHWRWSDGFTGKGADYRNWNTTDSDPDFISANQFCVNIGDGGEWWDRSCGNNFTSICYRGTQLDPELVLVSKSLTWSGAQKHCRENFVDLVSVRNDMENRKIQSLVPQSKRSWIGLFRDPDLFWSDGSSFGFGFWDGGKNVIGSMTVICGVTSVQRSGKWKFLSCDQRLPFVCYSPVTVKVLVKLKLQTDESVDLNDAALKASLQQRFQEELKARGVNAVTLRWSQQSDGRVFQKEKKKKGM